MGELGHPNYQHPQCLRQSVYNAEVDRFSHLAIYCATQCLVMGKCDLWQRFNNDDNLLFCEADFQRPEESDLFQTLWELEDLIARTIAGHLVPGLPATVGGRHRGWIRSSAGVESGC